MWLARYSLLKIGRYLQLDQRYRIEQAAIGLCASPLCYGAMSHRSEFPRHSRPSCSISSWQLGDVSRSNEYFNVNHQRNVTKNSIFITPSLIFRLQFALLCATRARLKWCIRHSPNCALINCALILVCAGKAGFIVPVLHVLIRLVCVAPPITTAKSNRTLFLVPYCSLLNVLDHRALNFYNSLGFRDTNGTRLFSYCMRRGNPQYVGEVLSSSSWLSSNCLWWC